MITRLFCIENYWIVMALFSSEKIGNVTLLLSTGPGQGGEKSLALFLQENYTTVHKYL
jgi:hypothetical protein